LPGKPPRQPVIPFSLKNPYALKSSNIKKARYYELLLKVTENNNEDPTRVDILNIVMYLWDFI
jgi:hypothetical protein